MGFRKYVWITSVILVVGLLSCKKDDDADPINPDELYIRFDLDGVETAHTGTTNVIHTGVGPDVNSSAGFFDFETDILIDLSMDLDSITGAVFESLIGQKIKIPACYGGCGTSMSLEYYIEGDFYDSDADDNPFPEHYMQINSVEFLKTIEEFGEELNQYIIEGEFNVNLEYNGDIKEATNGEFRLIFQESWYY